MRLSDPNLRQEAVCVALKLFYVDAVDVVDIVDVSAGGDDQKVVLELRRIQQD